MFEVPKILLCSLPGFVLVAGNSDNYSALDSVDNLVVDTVDGILEVVLASDNLTVDSMNYHYSGSSIDFHNRSHYCFHCFPDF